MRIIEHPKPEKKPAIWWIGLQLRCHECGCVFEIEARDAHLLTAVPGTNPQIQLSCPGCTTTLAPRASQAQ